MGDDPVLTLALEEQVYPILETIIPQLQGWCTVEKAKRLARLVADASAALSVELGVFGGRSLVAMAYGCKAVGAGRVEGIDPYTVDASIEGTNDPQNAKWWSGIDHEAVMRAAEAALWDQKLREYATIVRTRSLDAVSRYRDGSVSVLHQDSNHSREVSCAEVRAYASKMTLGGIWIMDDTNWETTADAQAMLVEMGFQLVEPHGQWGVFQAVGGKLKR